MLTVEHRSIQAGLLFWELVEGIESPDLSDYLSVFIYCAADYEVPEVTLMKAVIGIIRCNDNLGIKRYHFDCASCGRASGSDYKQSKYCGPRCSRDANKLREKQRTQIS